MAIIATKKSQNTGVINIDDVKLTNSKCPPPVTCNFNYDWCGYTFNPDDDQNWDLGFGRVENPKKLKFKDQIYDRLYHVYGMFLYTDFTDLTDDEEIGVTGPTMMLYSDVVASTPSTGSCLSFYFLPKYYLLSNKDKSFFEVHITDLNNNDIMTLYSTKTNSVPRNDRWTQMKFDVNYQKPFRFEFITYSTNSSTFFAIDDVAYDQVKCSQQGITTKPTTQKPATTHAPDQQIDCDFERNNCNWKSNTTKSGPNQFSPFVRNDLTVVNPKFPKADHTKHTKNGKFIYLYAGPLLNKISNIYAIDTQSSSNFQGFVCFTFWYSMRSETYKTGFNVTVKQTYFTRSFRRSDNKGDNWMQGTIQYSLFGTQQTTISIDAQVFDGQSII